MIQIRFLTIVVAAGMAVGSAAHSQEFPAEPITIIVPSSAGGASDIVARLFQQAVEDKLPSPS